MKTRSYCFLLALLLVSAISQGQDTVIKIITPRPNCIVTGYYFRIGPAFPVRNFNQLQVIPADKDNPDTNYYDPARTGAAMDMGYMIYFGPSFANNHLRAGIDATFLSFWFNSVNTPGSGDKKQYWYYFAGQKFGPVFSINPVERLIIDISYKLNAYIGFVHHRISGEDKWVDEWGKNLVQNELSMNIEYRAMMLTVEYNFGKITYDNLDSSNPRHNVGNSTFRLLFGFKL
jgi:hypothetical protein